MTGFGSYDAYNANESADAAPVADGSTGGPLVNRSRSVFVHASLVLFALAIVTRAVMLQLVDASQWSAKAEDQQVQESEIVPPRGRILDANGNVLVESRELVHLAFTPRNIKPFRKRGAKKSDPLINGRAAIRQALHSMDVSDADIRRVLDTTRKWVELPQLFLPSDVKRLEGFPGVTPTRVLQRYVSAPRGLLDVLGTVSDEKGPVGGLESEEDSLLRGQSGKQALIKDGKSYPVETPAFARVAARPGHTLTLTINQSLQELAERQLADGIAQTNSAGGDAVIVDPRDGSVLAMAGIRNGKIAPSMTVLTEPYEPGSVMKPFVISRAMELKRVHPDEIINTEGGKWTVAKRDIYDEHKAASLSMRDVIRLSSNIGAVKIAQRLSPREEFEAFRDFGFGTLTGLPYPAESRGSVPRPADWKAQTQASVAMGYEMNATLLQVAMAYVSIANDGELLQPALIREVHDAEGNLVFSHQRTVARRVLEPGTTKVMRSILASVVDSGTAVAADLATFDLAGKSGTARRVVNGRYDGSYNATFAALFPAQAPQYVIVVRMIDPKGKSIFGGTVAGRVVNNIVQGALATRDASLDRNALAAVAKPLRAPKVKPLSPKAMLAAQRDTARFDSLKAPAPAPVAPLATPTRVIVSLPYKAGAKSGSARRASNDSASDDVPVGELREVPSVYGLDTRQAMRALHAAGFHVSVVGGNSGRTKPAAGTLARTGSVIVLETPK